MQRQAFVTSIFLLILAGTPLFAAGFTPDLARVPEGSQLVIVSGDNQLTEPSQPSAPLVVRLTGPQGEPLGGEDVSWGASPSTVGGSPVTFFEPRTITGENGETQNIVTMTLPVPHTVTARVTTAQGTTISVQFTLINKLANNTSLTPNELQVAAAVDNACPTLAGLDRTLTAAESDLLTRCSAMISTADSARLKTAYREVGREEAAVTARNSTETAVGQRDNIESRLSALRSGGIGGAGSLHGLTLSYNGTSLPVEPLIRGLRQPEALAYPPAGDAGELGGRRIGIFVNGNLSFGDRESRPGDNEIGYDFDSQSVTAGVDFGLSDKTFLGVALGYSGSDSDFANDAGKLEVQGTSFSLYGSHNFTDSFFLDAIVTYGRNDYDSATRVRYELSPIEVIDQVAQGDTQGDLLSFSLSLGYDVVRGGLVWQTYGQATFTDLAIDAYDEQLIEGLPGFGLGLHVDQRDIESRTAVLGQSFSYAVSTGWGVFIPQFRLEWEHQFEDDARQIMTYLLNDPNRQPIAVTTDPLDADHYNVGAGFSAVFKRGLQIFLYYERAFDLTQVDYSSIDFGVRFEL